MKTHTIQRLRQTETLPPMPSKRPQDDLAGITAAPPTPKTPAACHGVAASGSVARVLILEPEDEIERLRAELDAAWKLDALKINKEVQRLQDELKRIRHEVAEMHDELYALGKPGDGILTRLANRLAAIVCCKEVS